MVRRIAVSALGLLSGFALCLPGPIAGNAQEKTKDATPKACFARLKKMAGDWVAKDATTGKETVHVRYRVISGGTAVEEELLPDTPGSMSSIYHLDNGSLAMTHYCSIGNQPHLKATKSSTPMRMEFVCTGSGGNMKSENEMHIHHLVITFASDDRMTESWSANKDGKQAGEDLNVEVTRKAP